MPKSFLEAAMGMSHEDAQKLVTDFLTKSEELAKEMAIKDSGKRREFESGMVRDVTDDKVDYLLVRDGPMFKRWAQHITNGAKKYAKRNWMLANGEEEYQRFRESAARHFEQWLAGDTDEDHAAAVFFNINGAEYVRAIPARVFVGPPGAKPLT